MDQQLDPKDLRMDIYRTGGGWNTIDNGIRITHIPTGLTVSMHENRSAHRNKVDALAKLTKLVFDSGPRETIEQMPIWDVIRLASLAAKIGDECTVEKLPNTELIYYTKPDGSVWDPILNLGDRYLLIKRCGLVVDFTEKRVLKRCDDGQVILKYWQDEAGEALAILRVAAEMQLKTRDREEIVRLQKQIAQLEGKQQ